MAASAFETLLARVATVLLGAGTAAGSSVWRDIVDPLSLASAPALVISRGGTSPDDLAQISGPGLHRMEFELACIVATDAWSTAADSLHQQAHAALAGDAVLLAADIELGGTEPSARAGDTTIGAITATYVVTVQPDTDLT